MKRHALPELRSQSPLGCILLLVVLFSGLCGSSLRAAFLPGEPDLSFHSPIRTGVAVNLDGGKLAVLGNGYYGGSPYQYAEQVVVLDQDGRLAAGPWIIAESAGSGPAWFRDLDALPDGSLLLSGVLSGPVWTDPTRTLLWRCLPDGSIDRDFGFGFDVEGDIETTLVLPDGSLLVGGGFANPHHSVIVRLAPDGTVDSGFASGTGIPGEGAVNALAYLPDGRFLAGGNFASIGGSVLAGLARLFPLGEIDAEFHASLERGSWVQSIALQPDGRILIAGYLRFAGEAPVPLARLLPDGSLDLTFSHASMSMDPNSPPSGLGLDSLGHVVLGGHFDSVNGVPYGGIVRFLSDGRLDPNFAAFDRTLVGKHQNNVLIAPGDDIYLLNNYAVNGIDLGVPRLLGGDPAPFKPMALGGPSALTLVEGTTASFNASVAGLPPPTYQWFLNGQSLPGATNLSLLVHSVRRSQQGVFSVVAANPLGSVTQQVATVAVKEARKLPGTNDVLFHFADPQWTKLYGVGLDSDGRLLIAGTLSPFDPDQILRFDGDGQRITGFGASVHVTGSSVFGSLLFGSVENQGVLVGGSFDLINSTVRNNLARLDGTGRLDPGFLDLGGASSNITALLTLPGGRSVVAGNFSTIQGVARERIAALNPDGTVDETFTAPVFGPEAQIRQLLPDAGGGVIVAGRWKLVDGAPRGGLVRLGRHGELDPAAFSSVVATSVVATVHPGGGLMAAWADVLTPSVMSTLRRFSPDGAPDPGFQTAGPIQGEVGDLVVDSRGRLMVAGPRYLALTPPQYRQVLRFLPTGALDSTYTSPASTLPLVNPGRVLFATQEGRLAVVSGAQFNLRLGDVDASSPPRILASLQSIQTVPGGPGALAVPVAGENLKFAWFFNGRPVGTGTAGYSDPVMALGDFGDYYVVVTNSFGSVTSSVARLQPGVSPPVFVRDTTPLPTAFPGDDVSLHATVSGTAPLHLQWYRNWVAMPGETRASLLLPAVHSADSAGYQLVAWNAVGEAHAWPYDLHVIDDSPLSEALDRSDTVWATDQPEQWTPQTRDAADGVDAVEVGPLPEAGSTWMQFRVVGPGTLKFLWKSDSLSPSHQFLFFVRPVPGFPDSQSHISSRSTSWVEETINIPAGVQYPTWYLEHLSGSGPDAAKGYLDQVRFNPTQAGPPSITRQPEGVILRPGSTLHLSVAGESRYPLRFQWRRDQSDLPGETRSVMKIANAGDSASGDYDVVLSNEMGSVRSDAVRVTVTSSASPIPQPIPVGGRGLEFQLPGEAGRDYILQASENLRDWFDPGFWTWPVTGKVVRLVDPSGAAMPHRFYRRVLEP